MSSKAGFPKTRILPAAALLLALLAGCVISPRRDGTTTPGTNPPPGGTNPGKLYVTNAAANTILRFDNALTATGDVTPAATITGSQIASPQYLLIDTVNDRLYVADTGGVLIYEKASTQNGNVAASRTIAGLVAPRDLALDRVRDLLYVSDVNSIQVFANASTANGQPAPVRTITPLSPGGSGFLVAAMLLDTSGDRLYMADATNSAVNIYDGASTLNGSVTAPRALSGANTNLSTPRGLQLDALGRLLVGNNNVGSITIYNGASTLNGNIAPSATIFSPGNLSGPFQIFLSAGNELYVADGTLGSIPIFSGVNSANGNINPARNIAGSHTTLSRTAGSATTATGVALDPSR